jgi:DNA-binding NtrC family response regulator
LFEGEETYFGVDQQHLYVPLLYKPRPVENATERKILASPVYQFSEAENASQALEKMRREPADLVLTDERMPGISGVATKTNSLSPKPLVE